MKTKDDPSKEAIRAGLIPVHIKSYEFTRLYLETLLSLQATEVKSLPLKVVTRVKPHDGEPSEPGVATFRLHLSILFRPDDDRQVILYRRWGDVHIEGQFEIGKAERLHQMRALFAIGGDKLYSAARELLLTISSRFRYGMYGLPDFDFSLEPDCTNWAVEQLSKLKEMEKAKQSGKSDS